MKKAISTILIFGLVGVQVQAQTSVSESLDQLKQNFENAKTNLEQYKLNQNITQENIKQTDAAIENLKEKKKTLIQNTNNIVENKKKMDQMKLEIIAFQKAEQKKMDEEIVEANKLKDLLEKLNKNRLQREANILAYDNKLMEIEQEKKNWDMQKEQLTDIQKAIDIKVQNISEDRNQWIKKNVEYKGEVKKWSTEAKVAEKTFKKYEKLNSDYN